MLQVIEVQTDPETVPQDLGDLQYEKVPLLPVNYLTSQMVGNWSGFIQKYGPFKIWGTQAMKRFRGQSR